jgi:hypothetical protein
VETTPGVGTRVRILLPLSALKQARLAGEAIPATLDA